MFSVHDAPGCDDAPETGYFTKHEAEQYHSDTMKLYKPIGVNIYDLKYGLNNYQWLLIPIRKRGYR